MSKQSNYSYRFNEFCLNIAQKRLSEDRVINLNDVQFDTLRLLVENQDQNLDKNDLVKYVCPTSKDGPNTIERAISDLRDKLHDSWDHPKIIKTVKGGYRFIAPVRKVRDEDADEEKVPQLEEVKIETALQVDEQPSVQVNDEENGVTQHGAANVISEDLKDREITFRELWRAAGRIIQWVISTGIIVTVAVSVVTIVSGGQNINLYVSIPQLFMLLVALAYVLPGPKGLHEDFQKATGYNNPREWADARYIAEKALGRYTMYWRGILATWLLLYFCLSFIESENKEQNQIVGIITTLFNNLNTAMLILCYNILNQPVEIKEGKRDISNTSWILVSIVLVVAFLLLEIFTWRFFNNEREKLLYGFSLISGIVGGIGMALYVGRLQSKFLGPSPPLVIALYSYTAIQSLFIFLVGFPEGKQVFDKPTVTLIGVILLNIALFLKCLLYLYMSLLFQSGRLLFYFVKVRRTYLRVDQEWQEFRNILKEES